MGVIPRNRTIIICGLHGCILRIQLAVNYIYQAMIDDNLFNIYLYSSGSYHVFMDDLPETEATRARNEVFPVPEGPYAKKLCR